MSGGNRLLLSGARSHKCTGAQARPPVGVAGFVNLQPCVLEQVLGFRTAPGLARKESQQQRTHLSD